jgi:2-polyprenyl-6-hydroxyphenyl methylase/3-demethylubiquinone-9 3-methyltransferase
MSKEYKNYYERYWSREEGAPPLHDPLTPVRAAIVAEWVGEGIALLDIGCGNGETIRQLRSKRRIDLAVGLDISEVALRNGLSSLNLSTGVLSCAESLPFQDATFDVVICFDVLEHLLDPESAVTEACRVLKDGCYFFCSVPYHGLLKNVIIALLNFESHFDVTGSHIRFFTKRSLSNILKKAGLNIIRLYRLGRISPLAMNLMVVAVKER